MLAFFHSLGKHSLSGQFLKTIASGFQVEEAYIFIIRIDISLCPRALLGFNDLMIFTISPEQISKVDHLSSVSKLIFPGVELLLSIIVHCSLSYLKILKAFVNGTKIPLIPLLLVGCNHFVSDFLWICFYKKIRDKMSTYILTTGVSVESLYHLQMFLVFSNKIFGRF